MAKCHLRRASYHTDQVPFSWELWKRVHAPYAREFVVFPRQPVIQVLFQSMQAITYTPFRQPESADCIHSYLNEIISKSWVFKFSLSISFLRTHPVSLKLHISLIACPDKAIASSYAGKTGSLRGSPSGIIRAASNCICWWFYFNTIIILTHINTCR